MFILSCNFATFMARIDSSFAHIVREARKNAKLTQQEVAKETDIDPSRLSRIETGKLEPTREEVTAILKAVRTEESDGVEEIVWDDLKHFSAPTWNALSKSDRSALSQADKALDKLKRGAFSKFLRGHIDQLKQGLHDCIDYLINLHHRVCLVGPIGVGKSTVANAVFNLTEEFEKRRQRKGSRENGLLPTGGGGTTAFEYRLSYGAEPSIRIEAQRDEVTLRDVRELCVFLIAEARGTEKRERAVSSEMERIYRNMTGLARRDGKDPVISLINRDTEADDLMDELTTRLRLSERTRGELLYREDRKKGQSEADWLRQHFEALNLGKLPDCPLPRRLEITLPNPALKANGFRFTLVDLRGIPTTDARPELHPDLVPTYNDPRALLVLCSSFPAAPDLCAQTVVEHLKSRSASNESPIDRDRVMLLVLPRDHEPESVRNDDGSPAQDRREGYELKQRQVVGILGETADKLAIQFFDARRDEPEPIRDHILNRVEAIREFKRKEIARVDKTIDDLIEDEGEAHFQETQKTVRAKIRNLLKTGAVAIDKVIVPAWINLIKALRQFHASSVWSVTRRGGEGRSIDIYFVFAELVREDSKSRTIGAVTGLKALLKEILGDADMRKKEMERSARFVSGIIAIADGQHETFLIETGQLGLNTLKEAFQKDPEFLESCAKWWGQGGGFRDQVAEEFERWFTNHHKVMQRLVERVDLAWNESFVAWLRTYTVDTGTRS
jgi:transcriptional regulator with XRE-family HTH domain